MKKLIAPTYIASFLLICAGLFPGVSIYMALIGLVAMIVTCYAGVYVLGSQDHDFNRALSMIESERHVSKDILLVEVKKIESAIAANKALEDRVSSAISSLRNEQGRLR